MNIPIFLVILSFVSVCMTINMLPDINYMLCGLDLKYGQPVEYSIRNPIYKDFVCGSNTIIIDGMKYCVPEPLYALYDPTIEQTSTNDVYTSSYSVTTSLTESLSYGFSPPFYNFGMYSQSEQYSHYNQMYEYYSSFTASSYLRITTYQTKYINVTENLRESFINDLMKLPPFYDKNTCKYFKYFFETYGTHYPIASIYGGSIIMTTTFSVDLLQTKTVTEIQEDINYQFSLLSSQETLTYYQEEQLTELNAIYSSTFQVTGGDPATFNATNNQPWIQSIPSAPLFISVKANNYTQLLIELDIYSDDAIMSFNNALNDYFLSSFIDWSYVTSGYIEWIMDSQNNHLLIINNVIYFMFHGTGKYYDIPNNKWGIIPSIPNYHAIYECCISCEVANNKIYCFGGNYDYPNPYTEYQNYMYDPLTNEWSLLGTIPNPTFLDWMSPPYLNYPTTLNDNIYMIGSAFRSLRYAPGTIFPGNLVYHIDTNTYSTLPYYSSICWILPQIIGINTTIYAFGGYTTTVGGNYHNCPYQMNYKQPPLPSNIAASFNTLTETWSTLTTMPVTLEYFSVINIGNYIWIIGGNIVDSGEFNTQTFIYNTINDTWASTPTSSSLIGWYGIYGKAFNDKFLFGVLEKDVFESPLPINILSRSIVEFC